MLGKFQDEPAPEHWRMLQHLIRYLKATIDFGIFIPPGSGDIKFEAWTDSDWARDKTKRRSRTGYCLTINGGPIVWCSKLQKSTAQSSTEAEFIALQQATREIRWVQSVLIELDIDVNFPTKVNQDNLGSIKWTNAVQGLRNVKHIEVKYHYVRDHVDNKHIVVLYVP